MMNFGPIKLLFTAVAALLILGPKRLPGAVRSLGKALGELKKASAEVTQELKSGLDLEPEKPHVAPVTPPEDDLRPGPR
jgi:sec-independent protein translocase protein TatB